VGNTAVLFLDDGMNSRERVLTTLAHKQADRIPFDLGGSYVTGITKGAYVRLAKLLGIETEPVELCDAVQQLAVVSDQISQRLEVDVRGVVPNIVRKSPAFEQRGSEQVFVDEWSVVWRRPAGALYFDVAERPLAGDIDQRDIERFAWPDPTDGSLFAGLEAEARRYYQQGYAVMLENLCAGIFEMCCRVRGTEQFLMDMAMNPGIACALLDKFVELKIRYYQAAAQRLGGLVQSVREVDDIAGQQSLLISPQMYREFIKPRHRQLLEAQKRAFPRPFHTFFHSDGAILDIIPDFIEIGVDVLNPVQLTAQGMDADRLKREFGKDLCFWGGGVDTQEVLPRGTPADVKQHIQQRIRQLSPGGGFVFAAVHNIQDDVPAENIAAMIEVFMAARDY
jgi:uroporphyrinogen decarboxylase